MEDSTTPTVVPPLPPTAAQVYAKALWDATPTTSRKQEHQLAYALGYPADWRVVRSVDNKKEDSDGQTTTIVKDVIHAVAKNGSLCTWFHHRAAQQALLGLLQQEAAGQTPALSSSSHLLPPQPLYTKGDLCQVLYEGTWYNAIIRRRKKVGDNFTYSVFYQQDSSTQDGVFEYEIRPGEDQYALAEEHGFPSDWKATRTGTRIAFIAPTGERFSTKKAALKHLETQEAILKDQGDPPWRTTGHEYIGRQILYVHERKVSGTRKVTLEQKGEIIGYIAATDVDSQGQPGFISESTGKPACLFHAVLEDHPRHPYSQYLLESQDLEEWEVEDCLLPEDPEAEAKRKASSPSGGPTAKKAKH